MSEYSGKTYAIQGATLIDGNSGKPLENSLVLIEGQRIKAVGQVGDFALPDGTEVVNAQGKHLLPGLVDSHVHLMHEGFVPLPPKGSLTVYSTIVAANNLRMALQSGITTMRAIADGQYGDLALRSAVKNRVLVGPRIFAAGEGICMTGGHGSGLDGVLEVDGPLAVRKAVRKQVKAGVDFIKLLTSHRSDYPEYSLEEIQAGVDEGHRLGKRVAIHAGNYKGTRMAAIAGVDSIEHGNFIDPQTADMIAEKDITVVPTIWVYHIIKEKIDGLGSDAMAKMGAEMKFDLDELNASHIWSTRVVEQYPKTLPMLMARGIRIAAGTDNVFADESFAVLHKEMAYMHKMGLDNMQIIQAATKHGAEVLGQADQFGTVETGKYADLIMVDGDPLEDISVFEAVSWVMKEGQVIPLHPEWQRKPIIAPLY